MGTGKYYSSLPYYENKHITTSEHEGRPGNHYQNLEVGTNINRNIQFLSRHNPGHSDQWPRPKHSNNSYLHIPYGEVKTRRYGNHSGTGQLHQNHNKHKPGHCCQSLGGGHTYGGEG